MGEYVSINGVTVEPINTGYAGLDFRVVRRPSTDFIPRVDPTYRPTKLRRREIKRDYVAGKYRNKVVKKAVIERNESLRYTHYQTKDSFDTPIDIYISDELKALGPFKITKDLLKSELERIAGDPFGVTNIDPEKNEEFARKQRGVNQLREEIQSRIGLPIAIKSTVAVPDFYRRWNPKEDLVDQYLFMRELQLRSHQILTQQQQEIVEFLPVYGAVRIGNREFLIMKYILDALEIEDEVVSFSYGWDSEVDCAFVGAEHPELLRLIGADTSNKGVIRWRSVARRLEEILGMPVNDLAGRNVLYTQEGNNKKYTIIDQVRNKK